MNGSQSRENDGWITEIALRLARPPPLADPFARLEDLKDLLRGCVGGALQLPTLVGALQTFSNNSRVSLPRGVP